MKLLMNIWGIISTSKDAFCAKEGLTTCHHMQHNLDVSVCSFVPQSWGCFPRSVKGMFSEAQRLGKEGDEIKR